MKQISPVKEFLADPTNKSDILATICSEKTLLAEALNNEQFIRTVAFYKTQQFHYYYPTVDVSNAILKFFPEKLLDMKENYFLTFSVAIGDASTLNTAMLKKLIDRLATISCDKTTVPDLDIFVSATFFGNNCSADDRWKIINNLSSYSSEIGLELKNLSELMELSPETVKRILPKCVLNAHRGGVSSEDMENFFDALPSTSKDMILENMVNGILGVHPEFLKSEYVSVEYFERNSDIIIKDMSIYEILGILEKHHTQFSEDSVFILKAALRHGGTTVKYLSSKNITEYANNTRPTARVNWAVLLYNKYVSGHPAILKKVVKAYCGIKASLDADEIKSAGVKIPDNIILELTVREATTLIKKIEPEDDVIFFNPETLKKILSSLSISDPVGYRENIAGKLLALISKHKTGGTVCDKILKYFGFGRSYELSSSNDEFLPVLDNAINKALSLPAKEVQKMAVQFLCDLIKQTTLSSEGLTENNNFVYAAEGKYRTLWDAIEAEEKNEKANSRLGSNTTS